MSLSLNPFNGEVSYMCKCGRTIVVPAAGLAPGESVDYCGCGQKSMIFSRSDVATQRKFAKLPELEE